MHDLGVDPGDDRTRRAVAGVREHCLREHAGQRFFDDEVEVCINSRTVTLAIYLGQNADAVVARLLTEQLADGGWNCEAENGSVRSSFHTTINVLEGNSRTSAQPEGPGSAQRRGAAARSTSSSAS